MPSVVEIDYPRWQLQTPPRRLSEMIFLFLWSQSPLGPTCDYPNRLLVSFLLCSLFCLGSAMCSDCCLRRLCSACPARHSSACDLLAGDSGLTRAALGGALGSAPSRRWGTAWKVEETQHPSALLLSQDQAPGAPQPAVGSDSDRGCLASLETHRHGGFTHCASAVLQIATATTKSPLASMPEMKKQM